MRRLERIEYVEPGDALTNPQDWTRARGVGGDRRDRRDRAAGARARRGGRSGGRSAGASTSTSTEEEGERARSTSTSTSASTEEEGERARSTSTSASASTSTEKKRAEEAVEIVVTGTRIEERARESLVTTDVIRREEIEKSGARNAAEILEERAGATIVRSFGGSALLLRGLDPEYTLVLVDGDRVPGRLDGALDLTRFGTENIERIEVVRGPGSALYGADAIGGVVNIITRETKEPFEADASASYGEHNVYDFAGRVGAMLAEPLSVQLTGGVHHGDAFGGNGRARGSAVDHASGSFKLWFEPDLQNRVRANVSYINQTFQGVDLGAGGAVLDRTQEQEQLSTALEHRLRATPKVQLVSRASYSQFRDQYLSDQRRGTQLDRYEDNREHLGQLTSLLSLGLAPAHKTTLGLEHLFQILDSERLSQRGNRYRLGIFAQHAWRVWRSSPARFDVVPGLRLDLDSQFGNQVSPKIALQWKPSAAVVLRASYGRGYRAPSFQELLLRFENPTVGYVIVGNPDLAAETSHGVDAGITYRPGEWLDLELILFRNDIRNMIAIVPGEITASGAIYTYDNITEAWTMGAETNATLNLEEWMFVQLGYTFMGTWDGENDRVLQGRPKHRISSAVRLAHPHWELELTGRIAVQLGRVYFVVADEDEERREAPSLAQLDLRLSKRLFDRLDVAVGVDNLLSAGDRYTVLRPRTIYGSISGKY